MGTNITIIEIDLGNIEKVIADNIAEISGAARSKLEKSIQDKKELQNSKTAKQLEKRSGDDKITNTMQQAYNKILESGSTGVLASEVFDIVKEVISTQSAFTLRMKKKLQAEGNKYRIVKKTVDKSNYYLLEPFNLQD
jgi:tyrosine-protein phosphatase YwqE